MNTTTATRTATAKSLAEELRRTGYVDGAPSHVPASIVDIDRRIYSRLKCGECGHRGHKVMAMHRGSCYRLVCACRKCGNEVAA
jgi:hypothetical protein